MRVFITALDENVGASKISTLFLKMASGSISNAGA
jgi:hypothetical protein